MFYPFAHQGTRPLRNFKSLKHYRKIFLTNECLGIFSHIPETLSSLSRFFGDSIVDSKLLPSRIGISRNALPIAAKGKCPLLAPLRFLFINSAHQNPANFYLRGGPIVLRFWKELRQLGINGRLYEDVAAPQTLSWPKTVSIQVVRLETGRSMYGSKTTCQQRTKRFDW